MTSPTAQRRRRRRLLALASAGLALCIGVSVTSLAAWQQSVNIAGDRGAGVGSSLLDIELSLDGGGHWTSVTATSTGSLRFDTDASLLTPGDTVYASVLLRAAVNSRGAKVKLNGGSLTSATLLTVLRYAAKLNIGSADCKRTTFPSVGDVLVGADSLLSTSASAAFDVPAPTVVGDPGQPVGLCLAVSLPDTVSTVYGGLKATPVWRLDATSI
ncbi:hypothetical protein [Amnibacterium setariae]|uniref:Ribosomally synthesized peptide with SipW-like signal peptide n=1 Tax=Amnibacterium setariae TaxID=2306585 RepID=A0A3A1TWU5_9MICO|nr:hypothetical protein [Amnibacterium setariae]RIX28279.1 hypothetical protein D1781_12555 [Amnibacterium setariae]